MALARVKTWAAEVLTPDDLNAEFDNLLDNALALISPLTGALDLNGFALQNLAAGTVSSPGVYFTGDANTGLYRSAADTVDVAAGGVRAARFNTVATGVNFLDATPSATGDPVLLEAEGSDADIDLVLDGKGTGEVNLAPTGAILAYAGTTAPTGWLLCDGAAVSRTTYARLFAKIADTFGVGDGVTTFNVPDLRGRFPLGLDNLGGSSANRVTDTDADTLGGADGDETKTIAEANLPAHVHTIAHTHTINHVHTTAANTASGHLIDSVTGNGVDVGFTGTQTDLSTNASSAANSGSVGSGTALDVMPPFLALGFIIRH